MHARIVGSGGPTHSSYLVITSTTYVLRQGPLNVWLESNNHIIIHVQSLVYQL